MWEVFLSSSASYWCMIYSYDLISVEEASN
jgi:hypothetical protein